MAPILLTHKLQRCLDDVVANAERTCLTNSSVEVAIDVQSDLRVSCCAVWVDEDIDTREEREDETLRKVSENHLTN